MGPRDLNSAPYSPVHCSSHSMTSFQSSELTELPVVENSQLLAQRVHSARYAPLEWGGEGGLAGPPHPPRVPLWSPPKAGRTFSMLNPLGTEGAEAKFWQSASNIGRGGRGCGGVPLPPPAAYGRSNTSLPTGPTWGRLRVWGGGGGGMTAGGMRALA